MSKHHDAPKPLLALQGISGHKRYSRTVQEEWLPSLQGSRGMRMYREMADNEPIIGGAFGGAKMLIRGAEWGACVKDEKQSTPDHTKWAEFADGCLHDMETPWSLVLDDMLSLMPFGFYTGFDSYKFRRGQSEDPLFSSAHSDGLIGLRDIEIRKQDTIEEWIYDENTGKPTHAVQVAPPNNARVELPLARLIHIRAFSSSGSPEGRSMLRNCYRPYYRKTGIEDYQSIGVERDLAGYPVAYGPPEIFEAGASAEQKATLAMLQTVAKKIRRDEFEGLAFPHAKRADGSDSGFEIALLSSGGSRQFNTVEILKYYDSCILIALLAMFLQLGRTSAGSFALSSDQTDLFAMALKAIMDSITGELNRKLIPRLMTANAVPREYWPEIYHGDIEKEDVSKWIANVRASSEGGLVLLTDADERQARDLLGLGQRDESDELMPVAQASGGEDDPGDDSVLDGLMAAATQPQVAPAPVVEEAQKADEPEEPPQAVGADDAAAMLGVSPGSIKRAIRNGKLPGLKVGNGYRVMIEDIRQLMKGGLL